MSQVIIGIHGLGNKPPAETLEKWWRLSIEEGFRKSDIQMPPFEFELAYWTDILHPDLQNPDQPDPKHPLYISEPYSPSDPSYQPEKAGDFKKRVFDYIGEQLNSIFLKDDLTINYSSVSDFILQRFFKDLAAYFQTVQENLETTEKRIQDKIRERLADVIYRHRRKKILLIAHSMGSIIAYDVLTKVLPDVKIDTLITIGSPLGIPIIRAKIAATRTADIFLGNKLRTPENVVSHWYNMADLRDKIALYHQLSDYFISNERGVDVEDLNLLNDYVHKDEINPHKAFGYLRSDAITQRIAEFYEPTAPKSILWLRNRLSRILMRFSAP